MQYLLLIYGNEESFGKMSKADQDGVLQEYGAFTKGIAQSGHYRGGNELAAISTATTVRVRDKKRLVTDGPFAETREQLGGYYLVQANDLDAAIGIAEKIPPAQFGTIEIRPVMEIGGLPQN